MQELQNLTLDKFWEIEKFFRQHILRWQPDFTVCKVFKLLHLTGGLSYYFSLQLLYDLSKIINLKVDYIYANL